jgi:hypothetical protein
MRKTLLIGAAREECRGSNVDATEESINIMQKHFTYKNEI